ncbi:putative non-hemolytic phospholipase C precursor [Talaromyces proteolyticus]|uniref:Non-hemolytic phospholipase C n=1 Tax=Talaromyces proteolyticus TaxID=1131652 RepID=A0AAD4Q1Z4_9EURO|nr:putative non-hemolytic phospholipase C precursor [Talaromyces proteolyticus]KAH8699073.1 putative non-hemolytic phospholipase C precursor [Talaromyces proteolyticus]
MALVVSVALGLAFGASPVRAGLEEIDHVVLFMQENRAFNHYFGTMAGVRGFNDPNVQVNPDGRSVWYQTVDESLSTKTDYLLPWYLNYLGGDWSASTQCMVAGSNGYDANHATLNGDLNNHWAVNNTPWSWGYFKKEDLPVHFAMAEAYTVNDMYQEGQITSTSPNRVTWVSGTINAPGSPTNPNGTGGVYIDNNETPGCETGADGDYSCYPLTWQTTFEVYESIGVTWQVWQDKDNFDDNPNAWFKQYQEAATDSPLYEHGNSFLYTLDDFTAAAANGTLPMVSIIIGQNELSEHPPWMPKDGAWLHQQIFNAVVNSPKYNSTALIVSYDETGGWGDAVLPYHSPEGTQGEWMNDPLGEFGQIFTGPGFRVPAWIVSPWTRGGRVFSERCDHNSQILFVEEWLKAKGYSNYTLDGMVPWRREHMCNYVNAFDFSNPDYSIPDVPVADPPHQDSSGNFDGSSLCQANFSKAQPPVPYGEQTLEDSLFFEDGFKEVVGYLTEGRYLTFEMNGYALSNPSSNANSSGVVSVSNATSNHESISQRWVIHYSQGVESGIFQVSSALDGRWIAQGATLVPAAQEQLATDFQISYLGNGQGYTIQYALPNNTAYLSIQQNGTLTSGNSSPLGFKVYSVSYHS